MKKRIGLLIILVGCLLLTGCGTISYKKGLKLNKMLVEKNIIEANMELQDKYYHFISSNNGLPGYTKTFFVYKKSDGNLMMIEYNSNNSVIYIYNNVRRENNNKENIVSCKESWVYKYGEDECTDRDSNSRYWYDDENNTEEYYLKVERKLFIFNTYSIEKRK